MKHLGDITKINGAEIEPVDCIIGGSPCQDLSIAGKRKGLAGERSGLFMEQIRIIKEMRDASRADDIRPRYMVWENVPGAFSSNKGEDFRAVLEETARVVDKDTVVPRPPCDKWTNAGTIMGNGWSIAWRTMDAQFWGVPQRRRRIALVADFGGESAPEILFKPESVSGDNKSGGTSRKGTSGNVERSINPAIAIDAYNHTTTGGTAVTLTAASGSSPTHSGPMVMCEPLTYSGENVTSPHNKQTPKPGLCRTLDQDSRNYLLQSVAFQLCGDRNNPSVSVSDKAYCLPANPMSDRGQAVVQPQLYEAYQHHGWRKGETSGTLTVGQNNTVRGDTPLVTQPQTLKIRSGCEGGGKGALIQDNLSATLGCNNDQTLFVPTYCLQGNGIDRADTAGCNGKGWTEDVCYTLNTIDRPAVYAQDAYDKLTETEQAATLRASGGSYGGGSENICAEHMTVRRLTPLECERLQGYPDGWTLIPDKKCSDSARYKALGNSIALPPWRFVLGRICEQIGRKATMGSLFDGIGGFPLIWQEINGKGSARWASEIEPFAIAVTKCRIEG